MGIKGNFIETKYFYWSISWTLAILLNDLWILILAITLSNRTASHGLLKLFRTRLIIIAILDMNKFVCWWTIALFSKAKKNSNVKWIILKNINQNAKQKNSFAVSNPPKCIANLCTQ